MVYKANSLLQTIDLKERSSAFGALGPIRRRESNLSLWAMSSSEPCRGNYTALSSDWVALTTETSYQAVGDWTAADPSHPATFLKRVQPGRFERALTSLAS